MKNSFKKKEPQVVEVKGLELTCNHCSNNLFWTRRIQLNTPGLTFLNLDWANRSATTFTCSNCTQIYWFDA